MRLLRLLEGIPIPNVSRTSKLLIAITIPLLISLLVSESILSESGGDTVFYAAPDGSGSECSTVQPCSLEGARDKVRTVNSDMSENITVYLRGGTYTLASPFELTSRDSGTNSYQVTYAGYPGETAVISGGTWIQDWKLVDPGRNLYRAYLNPEQSTRQLFVNGNRAVRARGPSNPAGITKNGLGYMLPDSGSYAGMQGWNDKGDLEFVGYKNWRSIRCGVADIKGRQMTIEQPCWQKSQMGNEPLGVPVWFENAYELLDEPGEWYWDARRGDIYYIPRSGENMTSAYIVAPRLETLVKGTGGAADPIHDIRFERLTFAYGAWTWPNLAGGYVPMQAGVIYTDDRRLVSEFTPAHFQFQYAERIQLERNTFTHMGGAAVSFDRGSKNNRIAGNRFEDLSSYGIRIGNTKDARSAEAERVEGNAVVNNVVTRIGVEYADAVGVFVGYASGTLIDHNDIYNVPYSAISVGWGWSDEKLQTLHSNVITRNRIRDFLNTLNDGGGIYTLGRQDNSFIVRNYISGNGHDYGSIYLDLGSAGFTVMSNVVSDRVTNWIFAQDNPAPFSHDNLIRQNYTDTSKARVYKANNFERNVFVGGGDWPNSAVDIMESAGVERSYR
jgi:hypothetical protein